MHSEAGFAPPAGNGPTAPGLENVVGGGSNGAFALHHPRAMPTPPPLISAAQAGPGPANITLSAASNPQGGQVAPTPGTAQDQAQAAAVLAAAQQFLGFMNSQGGGSPAGFHPPHGAFGNHLEPNRPPSSAALQVGMPDAQGGVLPQLTAGMAPGLNHRAGSGGIPTPGLAADVSMGGRHSRGPTPGLHPADVATAAYNRKDKR